MSKLLSVAWDREDVAWSEDDHQLAVVQWLRQNGYDVAADQNAGRRSARDGARRKALGMVAGEPDLRVYLPDSKLLLIEMKRWKGRLSEEQKVRHPALASLGHRVVVVAERTPAAAVAFVASFMARFFPGLGGARPATATNSATTTRVGAKP